MVTDRSALPLKGRRILVTRPIHQAAGLVKLIEQQGGEAIVFPVIEITANAVKQWGEWNPLQTNWLVFVSRNAVEHFLQGSPQNLPAHIKLAAAGEATAQTMRENGLTVNLQPELSNGSEGLLQLPEWQQMNQQHVVIVRGEGGRELMAETLRARGAKISYLEVYRREIPTVSFDLQQQACSADWLTATSVNGVTNLLSLLSAKCPQILQKPLLVVSERVKAYAIEQGFKQVHVSLDASDGAIIQRLIEMGSDHGV